MAVRVDEVEDLSQLPWRELARPARERGIRGGSRMRKAELIEALQRQDPHRGGRRRRGRRYRGRRA